MSKFIRYLFCSLVQISTLIAAVEPSHFPDRTPAYFADRYGSSKTSKDTAEVSFIHATKGGVKIKGQFSVREYRSGDLRVKATFNLPSLKLASVWLQIPRQWTSEQLDAALAAYGSDWKLTQRNIAVREWTMPDGSKAIFLLTSLEIQSPIIVKAVEKAFAEQDAKRKAVPKF